MSDEKKSMALATVDRGGSVPAVIAHYDAYRKFGLAAVYAGLAGNGTEKEQLGRAMVAIQFGAELGIGPTAALRGIYVQNGRPCCNAGLVSSVIKASGEYDYNILQRDGEGCRLQFTKNGSPIEDGDKGIISFTMQDAKTAGLTEGKNSHSYRKYARQMLFARAITEGARVYCPHLFAGAVYTRDEVGGEFIPEAEFDVEPDPVGSPQPAPEPAENSGQQPPENPEPAKTGQAGAAEPAKIDNPATDAQVARLRHMHEFASDVSGAENVAAGIGKLLESHGEGLLTKGRAGASIAKAKEVLAGFGYSTEPPEPEPCDHLWSENGICKKCGTVQTEGLPF